MKIFLCHSKEDKLKTLQIYYELINNGLNPWLDEKDILPGQDWDYEIRKAIRNSSLVLVILSNTSIGKSGYVQKEIKIVLDISDEQPEGKVFIIPIKIEECEVPNRLSKWQWFDLYHFDIDDLVVSIKKILNLELNSKVINNNILTSSSLLYTFTFQNRNDEIFLDGTQEHSSHIEIMSNLTVPSINNSIQSISPSLFPFENFTINLDQSKCDKSKLVSLEHVKSTSSLQKWVIDIDPPVQKNEYFQYSYQYKMFGSRIMCLEDIIEVAKINHNLTELVVRPWKRIPIPTEKWSWKITLPQKYGIKSPQPCVIRNKRRVKELEVELIKNRSFNVIKNKKDQFVLELKLSNPYISLGYGFSWVPPSRKEYDELCLHKGINPYHGKIQRI